VLRLILTRARSRERTNRATEVPPPPSPEAPLLRAVEPRDMAAIAAMVAALAAEHGETASAIPDALGRDLFAKDVRH
jgi:hypothetical protein